MKGVGVQWIMLADSAEVINNKVYLMGGGWETLTVNAPFPVAYPCAVVASFSVPRGNGEVPLLSAGISVHDDAENSILSEIEVQVQPTVVLHEFSGDTAQLKLAFRMLLNLDRPGRYYVVAKIEGVEQRLPFAVVAGPSANEIEVKRPRKRKQKSVD
jgi:hypothetical protein